MNDDDSLLMVHHYAIIGNDPLETYRIMNEANYN